MIQDLIKGLSLAQEQEDIQNSLREITNPRLKAVVRDSIPFSSRLNDWLRDWYKDHSELIEWSDVDDFDNSDPAGTYERHLKRFHRENKIVVWTGESDHTIYGKPEINHIARAWHDYVHYTEGLDYSPLQEIKVGAIQSTQLPQNWYYEKQLINIDVIGQILHYLDKGHFPEDQRLFTLKQLGLCNIK